MRSRSWRFSRRLAGSAAAAGALVLAGASLVWSAGGAPPASGAGDWLRVGQLYEPASPARPEAVVLLHGFGGSPWDVKPLFDALARQGYRVAAPLIPGEGADAAMDEHPEADDLVAWMRDLLVAEAARSGRKPYVVGFSKGGALASVAAAEGLAARVVLLAPYFGLPRGDGAVEKASRIVAAVVDDIPKPWKGRINDPEGYARYEPGRKEVSLEGFLRLQDLARLAGDTVGRSVDVPVLVLASPNDDVASFSRTKELFSSLPGAGLKAYPRSNHVLLYDYDAESVIAETLAFFAAESP